MRSCSGFTPLRTSSAEVWFSLSQGDETVTLRDKINQAVDKSRNCRQLSYKALDLLEELFNAELKSMAGGCKKPECIFAVLFHSTGGDFETSVELFSSLEFAAQYVARDVCQLMNAVNIPTDTPYDRIATQVKSSKRYAVTIRGASYIWRVAENKVDAEC